jgi:polar amino acid transport system ATP-binding protein
VSDPVALLHAHNIHKRFGAVEVLKGIDLEVRRGEVVALIGSSGSGKTTFLRCVNMLEEFQEGEILLDGESIGYRITPEGRKRLPERMVVAQRARIGIVFQGYNLFPHLTAEQNVTLGLAGAGRAGGAAGLLPVSALGWPAAASGDRPRGGGGAEAAAVR